MKKIVKELLLNKVLYELNYDGNLTTYQYIYDTTYYKLNTNSNTREEITDSNIITIITFSVCVDIAIIIRILIRIIILSLLALRLA